MRHFLTTALLILPFLLLGQEALSQTLSLDGEWTLDYWQQGRTPVRGPQQMDGIAFLSVPATVPGNVELDLQRAGLVEAPLLDLLLEDGDECRREGAFAEEGSAAVL